MLTKLGLGKGLRISVRANLKFCLVKKQRCFDFARNDEKSKNKGVLILPKLMKSQKTRVF